MATLLVYKGDSLVTSVPIAGGALRIGRLAENDVVLPDDGKAVSRYHAELRVEGNAFVIYDLNSQNGTWVAASRINRATLSSDEEAVIGPYRLRISDEDTEPITPPPADPAAAVTRPVSRSATSVPTAGTASGTRAATSRPPATTTGTSTKAGPMATRGLPLYAGAGVAVLAIGAALAWMLFSPADESLQTQVSTTTSIVPEPPPPVDPDAEHLQAASQLVEAGSFAEAVSAHLEPVLTRNPANLQAGLLWNRAQVALAPPRPIVTAPPQPPVVPKPLEVGIARLSGESDAAYFNRLVQARSQYDYGEQMLAKSEWATAREVFERLATSYPEFRDVAAKAQLSRDRLQEAAREAMAAGRAAEASQDYAGAVREYTRARALGANPDADIARVNAEARTKAGALMKRARLIENYAERDAKLRDEAVGLFRQVVALLPPGDPERTYAESRLLKLSP